MKKNIIEKRIELEQLGIGGGFGSPMMITGLNHTNQNSHIQQIGIPKPPTQTVGRNRTLPKPF